MSKFSKISMQMYNYLLFGANPRFLDQFVINRQSATFKYSYKKDNFPLNVTTHLIFFWPATIQYPKLKFGMTKSADLDLYRSFFQKLIWGLKSRDMLILNVTTDLGHPVETLRNVYANCLLVGQSVYERVNSLRAWPFLALF